MDSLSERLSRCFSVVFPNLSPQGILEASAGHLSDWDSIAQVNLLCVISEEFGLDVDFVEFEGATSYASIRDRLSALQPPA